MHPHSNIPQPGRKPWASRLALALATALLAACGGGGGADTSTAQAADAGGTARAQAVTDSPAGAAAATAEVITTDTAARFLTQATFGPTDQERTRVMKAGYANWIDRQWKVAPTSHRAWWETRDAAIRAADSNASAGQDQVFESFWKQALTGQDQLRQRVVFALSQIFVISAVDGTIGNQPRAMAAWLDMLGDKGLTTYRELLEAVSLHPMMGLYLSHLRNQKADLTTGRVPDENYAREILQLFSIGVVQLNLDGTPVLVNGSTVDTYRPADISGMAQVFTGFSWACPAAPASTNCFNNGSSNNVSDPDRYIKPMVAYPQFHSTTAKTFLGVTIPAQNPANPMASLKVALDTLDAHPNTAPFISRQLIQRLVTSNPSAGYVGRVAAAFANNGAGVRGDLKAVVKAVLTDDEARNAPTAGETTRGKLREPVVRFVQWARTFNLASPTGLWNVGNVSDPATRLGQSPLRSPSVFNFFRPGYVPPNSALGTLNLNAPEFQITNESSVVGWANWAQTFVAGGVGETRPDYTAELAVATDAAALVRRVSLLLTGDSLSAATLSTLTTAVGSMAATTDAGKLNRVYAAVHLVLCAPEYLVQV